MSELEKMELDLGKEAIALYDKDSFKLIKGNKLHSYWFEGLNLEIYLV